MTFTISLPVWLLWFLGVPFFIIIVFLFVMGIYALYVMYQLY